MSTDERTDLQPIQPKSGPALAIHLNSSPMVLPGHKITGYITREEPIIAPQATIEIAFIGRSVVHYTKSRSNGSGGNIVLHHYSHVVLFEEKQTLLSGPLHISADNHHDAILDSEEAKTTNNNTWPFEFTFPTHPSPTTSNIHEKHPSRSFLPIDAISLPETLSTTTLPTSFYFPQDTSLERLDASVEYYLEATLTESHIETSLLTGHAKSKDKIKHARQIITLRHAPSPPVHDFKILRHIIPNQSVSSPRLLPGRGKDSRLSTHEHLSKFFKSSSVPRFGFAVEMEFPTLLQLGNDLPLGIRVLSDGPGGEHTSEGIRGVEQIVTIDEVRLRITERVNGKLDVEKWSGHEESFSKDGKLYYCLEFQEGSSKWDRDGNLGLVVPCVGGFDTGACTGRLGSSQGDGLLGEKKGHRSRLSWGGRSERSRSRGSSTGRKSVSKEEEAGFGYNAPTGVAVSRNSSDEDDGDEKVPAYTYHPTNEGSSAGGSSQGPFLQLSEKLNLRLEADKIQGLPGYEADPNAWDSKRRPWKWNIVPSFTTFNISVKYLLRVEVTLNIVGEKVKVSAEHGFNLVEGWN